MKKIKCILLFVSSSLALFAQDLSGTWHGLLKFNGTQISVVFHISKAGQVYSSTMDSPDQGVNGIPVTSITVRDSVLNLGIESLGVSYEGRLTADNKIEGTFHQAGQSLPLILSAESRKQTPHLFELDLVHQIPEILRAPNSENAFIRDEPHDIFADPVE